MSMRGLFSAIIEMTRHVHHVFAFWQWRKFLSNRGPWLSCMYTRVLNQFRNKWPNICDIKSKYLEEYSTVDKVGGERLLARKSCFCVELIASWHDISRKDIKVPRGFLTWNPYRNLFRAISYYGAKAYGPEGRGEGLLLGNSDFWGSKRILGQSQFF